MSARTLRKLAVCAAITLARAAGLGSRGFAVSAQPYPGDRGDDGESEEEYPDSDFDVPPELPDDGEDTTVHPDTPTGSCRYNYTSCATPRLGSVRRSSPPRRVHDGRLQVQVSDIGFVNSAAISGDGSLLPLT